MNETRAYNTLGQLTGISYGGTLRHEYRYSASANDGRAVSYKNWQSGEDVQYTYDSLARLTKAETLGPDWGQSFGYDGWGNLLSKSVTKGSAPVMSVTADAATNRLVVSGMAYDANGNVTNMPGVGTLAYDARNRITGTGGVPTRGSDPGNRKIWWKDSNGITFVDYWLPNGEKLVTYKIDESTYYSNQSYTGPVQFSTISRYLHFAGRQVKVEGRYGVGGYVEWPQPDRLSSNARHHPYGEERSTSSTEYKFATYQREAGGLDYALNRYYSSVYGRFLSSDPCRASGGPSDPGSWNRYAYVRGDPVNLMDSLGLYDHVPPEPLSYCEMFRSDPSCRIGVPAHTEREASDEPRQITSVGQVMTAANAYRDAFLNGVYTDCEALSFFADSMAQNATSDLFLSSFKAFYSSTYGGFSNAEVSFHPKDVRNPGKRNTGFKDEYRDWVSPKLDQVHHFAFFFEIGASLVYNDVESASTSSVVAAIGLEILNAGRDGVFNVADIRLGVAAGMLGYQVARGAKGLPGGIAPSLLGSEIRKQMCK